MQLTHANMVAEWRACDEVFEIEPGGRSISFLPSAHVADRWSQLYAQMFYGTCIHCCPDPREMVAYTTQVRPTFWGGVPRIWEKLKVAMEAAMAAEEDAERKRGDGGGDGGRPPPGRRLHGGRGAGRAAGGMGAGRRAVFAPVRALLGLDEVTTFAVGAAPTPPEVIEFFLAMGIEICELWGMSETSSAATVNPPGRVRVGTVGPPLPGVELKLAEDGELLVRGPIVMKGYRNMPERTAEALARTAGWRPATSARSTRTATCGSSTARRS